MTAIKMEIAQLFFINSLTDELYRPLVQAAMFLDSFNDIPPAASAFIESMQRRRQEIDSFYLELMKLDRTDPFCWQRVYTMLGIASDTKKSSFLAGIKEKFRFGQKSSSTEDQPPSGARQVGRLTID